MILCQFTPTSKSLDCFYYLLCRSLWRPYCTIYDDGGGLGLLFSQLWNHTFQVKLPIQFAVIIGAALFLALINNIPLAASLFLIEITGQPLINILPIALAILIGFMTQKYLLRINKLLTIRKKQKKLSVFLFFNF
nr:chloride channel protein [Streptococcus didelphis]